MAKTEKENQHPLRHDVEELFENLQSADAAERARAASDLGHLYEDTAIEPLQRALSDEDPSVREAAAEAMTWISSVAESARSAVPALCDRLSDLDWWVRMHAAEALANISDEAAVDPLVEALKDKHPLVRMHVAGALGAIGDPRATEPLKQALRDVDPRVRMYAAAALGSIRQKGRPVFLSADIPAPLSYKG